MHYVYLLQSQSNPSQRYVGLTSDLRTRLAKHNNAEVPHTSKHTPWTLACYIALPTRVHARTLEHYLKSASGRAFSNKHLYEI